MKRLYADVNDEEFERLKEIAEDQGITVRKLIGAFVQDLTGSNRSGGADERDRAWEWLYRNNFDNR